MVTTISSGKVPFATLQVLWVKLIVGTLAAVAITVEEPAEIGQLPRFRRDQPFMTGNMRRNIIGQAIYPIIILCSLAALYYPEYQEKHLRRNVEEEAAVGHRRSDLPSADNDGGAPA